STPGGRPRLHPSAVYVTADFTQSPEAVLETSSSTSGARWRNVACWRAAISKETDRRQSRRRGTREQMMSPADVEAALSATHFGSGWGQVVDNEARYDPVASVAKIRGEEFTSMSSPFDRKKVFIVRAASPHCAAAGSILSKAAVDVAAWLGLDWKDLARAFETIRTQAEWHRFVAARLQSGHTAT